MNPTPTQPDDLWNTLPSEEDEFYDESRPCAEERAMHVVRTTTQAEDPGRSEVDLDGASDVVEGQFDDEEPEAAVVTSQDDDIEEDVEEVLESQHYAFEPETESS